MSKSTNSLKIPFGFKNGRYFGPSDVPNGDKCGCVCPGCEQPLRANQGSVNSKRRAYFSHQVKGECANGYETAIHRYAKQIIADELSITFPEYRIQGRKLKFPLPSNRVFTFQEDSFVKESQLVDFERSELEKTVHPFRPDVTLHKSGCTLYVEVCVTNPVTDQKADFFKDKNLLEVYLKELESDVVFDSEEFKKTVIEAAHRAWIHCNSFKKELQEHRAEQEIKAQSAYEKYLAKLEIEEQKRRERIEKERKAREAAEKKQQQISENKSRYRTSYQRELAELEYLYSPGVIEARCKELYQDSQPSIETIKQHFNHGGRIPMPLTLEPDSGWIFNTHWVVWQSYVYAKYIQQAELGSTLNANNIKKDVVSRYGVIGSMVTLNNLKQQQKKQGKSRGAYYGDKGAWFFSDDENRKIISPYKPVISFLSFLELYELIERDTKQQGLFYVRQNCVETAYNIQQERIREQERKIDEQLKLDREAKERRKREIEEQQRKEKEAIVAHQEQRIYEISNVVASLYDRGITKAFRCVFCTSISEEKELRCEACGNTEMQEIEITAEFVQTIDCRLRCDPRIRK